MRSVLAFVFVVVLLPASALAQDAGELDDAGVVDASVPPDASDADERTREQCLDGYDRSQVDVCAGKQAGAECTFPGGERGQCAALRCLEVTTICVATRGQPAPPPNLGDAGTSDAGVDAIPTLEGGGCAAASSPASSGLWFLAAALLWRRRSMRSR